MTQRTRRWTLRVSQHIFLATFWLAGGCATTQFGTAVSHYAAKTAVTDAAARYVKNYDYYRFNSILLSDLDDAIASADVQIQRKMAAEVLRGANALSQTTSSNEIERMPESARKEIAEIAGIPDDFAILQHHFSRLANAALNSDLREVDRLLQPELRRKLTNIRKGIENLPDDKKRSTRKVLYAWAASLTARGIAREEAKLSMKCRAKVEKKFDRVVIWTPGEYAGNSLLRRYAPIISMEWPKERSYDVDFDKIGAVKLSTDRKQIEVQIDTKKPCVYTYSSVAKIADRRFRQLNYVWWFSERPEMTKDDPVAGHIDGAMIRITLDDKDNPIFIESTKNCGCSHEVFVSKAVELAAYQSFGAPLDGKRFSVEKFLPDKHDIVVTETFDTSANPGHPLILTAAGYHEVYQIKFNVSESINGLDVLDNKTYNMSDYGILDRLPLKGGIASMFGPDGLVHFAGRPEGFLLAPSGILSAGQPRKRGTQRVRWDDFLHDDPHLLENTLRIPPLD